VAAELIKEYRKAAEAALARGDHRRAAAIYGKLLGDYRSAAQALLRGGLYRDAAAIYLARLDDPRAAALALESAGDLDRAIALYRRVGEHERAGDLLARIGEDDAALEEYRIAADRLVGTGNGHLAAGDMLLKKTGRADLAMGHFCAGWERRPAPNAVECAIRLAALHSGSGDVQSIFRLIDEADALFERHADAVLASRYYNEIAGLAASWAGLGEDEKDGLRDRALLGLAARARRLAPADSAAPAVVRDLFHPRGDWPVAMIGDAEFAVKAAAARPAPPRTTRAPGRFTIGTGTVSAVGFADGTEEVFVGFTSGRLARFRPATGEVEWLSAQSTPVISIATADDGEVVVTLHADEPGMGLLSSYVRQDDGWYSPVIGSSVHLSGDSPWLAPNLIAEAGCRLVGLWDGATMAVIEAMTLLTRERLDLGLIGDDPTAGFLLHAEGGIKTACVAFSHDRWAMVDAERNVSYASQRQPAPRRPSIGLRSLPIAPTWLSPTCFEIAYAGESGDAVHVTMRIEDGLSSSPCATFTPAGGYLVATVGGRNAVVAVVPGWVLRFRTGTSRLRPSRSTSCQLARPVACFRCQRTASLVVIDAEGDAEVIADIQWA
jgi:tetratricopeptide (TPR) repeat protein